MLLVSCEGPGKTSTLITSFHLDDFRSWGTKSELVFCDDERISKWQTPVKSFWLPAHCFVSNCLFLVLFYHWCNIFFSWSLTVTNGKTYRSALTFLTRSGVMGVPSFVMAPSATMMMFSLWPILRSCRSKFPLWANTFAQVEKTVTSTDFFESLAWTQSLKTGFLSKVSILSKTQVSANFCALCSCQFNFRAIEL